MGSAKHAGVMDPPSYRLEQLVVRLQKKIRELEKRIEEIEKSCTEAHND